MRKVRSYVVLAVLVVLVVAGCSSSSKEAGVKVDLVDMRGKATGEPPTVEIAVKDNVFVPRAVRVDPGTTVTFTNEGRSAHNVRASDASQDFGEYKFGVEEGDFAPGGTYSYVFEKPGVYEFYCSLHGTNKVGMIGAVVVGDVEFSGRIGTAGGTATGAKSGTLRVPADYPTVQAAVDAAQPGSLILVAPGVYKEAVTVTTERLVIRGESRAGTVLDGEFALDNGIKILANGVAVENMTARNFTKNGFFWTGVKGYRGSYLTAIRNGDYGIYAFDATDGQFDHDYGAGSPDAGFYIGQCYPCNAVITDSISEWNGLGYSGTNAGGNLLIVNSVFRNNRAGIVPNSGTGEANPPEKETTIVGNLVYDNNNAGSAAISIAQTAIGNGILLAGGVDNVVERNRVYKHDIVGIGAIPLPEKVLDPDNPKAVDFSATGNSVRDNVVSESTAADLISVTSIADAKDAGGNCFSGNTFSTSIPQGIEQLLPCGSPASPEFTADIGKFAELLGSDKPKGNDYKTVALPEPPALEEMPDAKSAPARPADTGVPVRIDIAVIKVPDRR